jgi:hypothetical protein
MAQVQMQEKELVKLQEQHPVIQLLSVVQLVSTV